MTTGFRGALPGLVGRPLLLLEALRVAFGSRARGGVRPSAEYIAWRVLTAYGESSASIPPSEFIDFLRWRRGMRKMTKQARVT